MPAFSSLVAAIPEPATSLAFFGTLKGPEFIMLYVVWLALVLGAVWYCRFNGHDTPLVSTLAIACFLLPGVIRYLVGTAQGMKNWNNLGTLMIVGAIVLLMRARHAEGDSGDSSSCSSSGGDGGGCGGGGGGCGGCGGD